MLTLLIALSTSFDVLKDVLLPLEKRLPFDTITECRPRNIVFLETNRYVNALARSNNATSS
jgi:hypothetical protein